MTTLLDQRENLGKSVDQPSKRRKKGLGYTERTHSNCRSTQGQYVHEGGGILWAYSEGGEEITSTKKNVVNPKMGIATDHNGAQGISGSN